ncbi:MULTISPECIES: hypothetical protein [unclassified Mucilaginibacter]|jgi:hypothetical protein|uniref:hypothetical protein n=1 Tax=unclassified Mucilaginibacter TaxID=2617802 RepID=UPI0008C03A94|nr:MULTISPECIES: hypothetical protein [unclassified Mucilaginibacter]WDF78479.1 hypothetical protein PQ469_00475 [Mucilaginibacter sp. KACC 22773]SEO08429.1 hypothetical protein SAMN05428947_101240 [Mucilaginibacter sp. OK283]
MDGMRIYKYNPYFILPMILSVLLLGQPVYSIFNKLLIYKDYSSAIILVLVIDYFLLFFTRHIYYVLRGTPAIIITREFIFIEKNGYTIAWRDIESIDKVQGLRMSLRTTWRNWPQIKNPIVRIYYGYMASGISIPGILIAGDTEQMSITIRDYYFKYRYD